MNNSNGGYQPIYGILDSSLPPQGGSGVPNKENIYDIPLLLRFCNDYKKYLLWLKYKKEL